MMTDDDDHGIEFYDKSIEYDDEQVVQVLRDMLRSRALPFAPGGHTSLLRP